MLLFSCSVKISLGMDEIKNRQNDKNAFEEITV